MKNPLHTNTSFRARLLTALALTALATGPAFARRPGDEDPPERGAIHSVRYVDDGSVRGVVGELPPLCVSVTVVMTISGYGDISDDLGAQRFLTSTGPFTVRIPKKYHDGQRHSISVRFYGMGTAAGEFWDFGTFSLTGVLPTDRVTGSAAFPLGVTKSEIQSVANDFGGGWVRVVYSWGIQVATATFPDQARLDGFRSAARDYFLAELVLSNQTHTVNLGSSDAQVYARGGKKPYTFQVLSGDLPPGLRMNRDGSFSGRASQVGTYQLKVRVTDSKHRPTTAEASVTIEVIRVRPPREDELEQ